jgi:hypothetical protein
MERAGLAKAKRIFSDMSTSSRTLTHRMDKDNTKLLDTTCCNRLKRAAASGGSPITSILIPLFLFLVPDVIPFGW